MQLLYLCFLRFQLDLGLGVVPIFVALQLGHLEFEGLNLFNLKCNSDVRLVAFLFFGLEGEPVLAELLTHRAILLQHDLLVLRKLAQFLLRPRRSLIERSLQVDSRLLA